VLFRNWNSFHSRTPGSCRHFSQKTQFIQLDSACGTPFAVGLLKRINLQLRVPF
jgi:hypothetical protein